MAKLDLSQNWTIHAEASAKEAAAEIAMYCGLLRETAGLKGGRPQIVESAASPNSTPCIALKAAAGNPDSSGFSWQFGNDRIEISGDSMRGLWNGVFDFLAALGLRWSGPGQEGLPQARMDGSNMVYPLKTDGADNPAPVSAQERKRFFVDGKTNADELVKIVKWAARNQFDALVFSLGEKWLSGAGSRAEYAALAKRYAFYIEAGGRDFSLLLPRRLFLLHRDLFRMELGKRKSIHHFCPTNPKTTSRITERANYLFSRASAEMTVPRIFHLLPDKGQENTWCACPACRAFNPAEQNLIAVNSAADALAKLDPDAKLSFLDYAIEPEAEGITPRKNTFRLFASGSVAEFVIFSAGTAKPAAEET